MAERDDDREAVDRAFAELVAGYHLTAERPDPHSGGLATTEDARVERVEPAPPSAPPVVLPYVDATPVLPTPLGWRAPAEPSPTPSEAPTPDERYVPDPLPPLSRPGAPALIGWAGILFAAVLVLAAGFGVPLPGWLGWLAVTAFIVGFVVLLTQLPRHRPPGSGDGAVL